MITAELLIKSLDKWVEDLEQVVRDGGDPTGSIRHVAASIAQARATIAILGVVADD